MAVFSSLLDGMASQEAEIGGRCFQLYKETASAALDLYVKFTTQNVVD